MPITEITTIPELLNFCNDAGIGADNYVQSALDDCVSSYTLRDNGGDKYIEVDWSYDDLAALKTTLVGTVLPEVLTDDHRKQPRQMIEERISDFLWERSVEDWWFEGTEDYAYNSMIEAFENVLQKTCQSVGIPVPELLLDKSDWLSYFREELGIYASPDFANALGSLDFDVNIFCSVVPDEPNTDFVNIPRMPEQVQKALAEGMGDAAFSLEVTKNFATKMLEQQGYSLADYFVNERNGKFIDSMRVEYGELFAPLALTAILAKVDYNTLINLYASDGGPMKVGTESMLGFYSPFDGSGSMLDLKLEVPLAITSDDIWDVQIEGSTTFSRYGYWTIQDTYGLGPECWTKCLS